MTATSAKSPTRAAPSREAHANLRTAKNLGIEGNRIGAWLDCRQFVEVTAQLPRSIPAKHGPFPWKIFSHFPAPRPHSDVVKDVSDMTEKRTCVSMKLA